MPTRRNYSWVSATVLLRALLFLPGWKVQDTVLVEIQALVAASSLGTPRRAVVGWDSARLSMILAVLEAHCGVKLGSHDVYLNVAGGIPAYRSLPPDLAVAAALVSSITGNPLEEMGVYFGEISLSGAVRPVAHSSQRLKEAEKLGFASATFPAGSEKSGFSGQLATTGVDQLTDLVVRIAAIP